MDFMKIIFIAVVALATKPILTDTAQSTETAVNTLPILNSSFNVAATLKLTSATPATTLSSSWIVSTVPDTTTTTVDRISRTQFELNSTRCAREGRCVFLLRPEFPVQSNLKSIIKKFSTPADWCSSSDDFTEGCCENLRSQFNDNRPQLPKTTSDSEYASYVKEIVKLLGKLECSQLYCWPSNQNCAHVQYVGCEVECRPQPTFPSFPPTSTWTSDVTTSRAQHAEESDAGDEAASSGTTTIIIIVVSCVVAFLAGIGGALLITCLRKRRRAERGRGNADAGNKGSTELNTLSTKPDTLSPNPTNNNSDYSATRPPSFSEHEYSCITDPSPTLKHSTATAKPPNNVSPVRHLPHDRKLPTAPPPLAETASRDNTAEGERTEGDYTLARRPVEEGEYCLEKCEDRNVSSLPENRDSGEGYFILEENGKQREKKLTKNSETTDQYFVLETERKAAGAQVDDLKTTSQPERAINGRERNLLRVSAEAECYSPLDLSSKNAEDSEYTVLELSEMESKKREASRDYLEVIPDYVLSKPIV